MSRTATAERVLAHSVGTKNGRRSSSPASDVESSPSGSVESQMLSLDFLRSCTEMLEESKKERPWVTPR